MTNKKVKESTKKPKREDCPRCKGTGLMVVDEDKVPCLYCSEK